MNRSQLLILITIILFACGDHKERTIPASDSVINDFQPSLDQINIRTKEDVKHEADNLIRQIEEMDLSPFDEMVFEDLGYKLTIYFTKADRGYSIFAFNDPIDKLACFVGMEQFAKDFGFEEHYNEEHIQYHIDKKDSNYYLYARTVTTTEVYLDEIPTDSFNLKYTSDNVDAFSWASQNKDLMKELNLKTAGSIADVSVYDFTMKGGSTLYYYPNGALNFDGRLYEHGEWILKNKYFLTYGIGVG